MIMSTPPPPSPNPSLPRFPPIRPTQLLAEKPETCLVVHDVRDILQLQ